MHRQLILLTTIAAMMAGCGGKTTENAAPSGDVSTAVQPSDPRDSTTTVTVDPKTKDHARDEVWTDEKGQKWLGKVPFDAFFDQPYEVASNQTPLGSPSNAAVAASSAVMEPATVVVTEPTAEPVSPSDQSTPVASSGGDGWSDLITAEALDEEVKTIRNFMNENLQSVGSYNSAMLMLPPKAAAMAALAEVASKHSQAVSWKDDAAYIRDLGKQMNSSALQRGAKDQKRLLELYEAASDTLNRSRPAGLAEPSASDSFAEAAEMRLVMMRMEEAEKKMRTEAGSESALATKKTMVAHEASLLAVMAKIVSDPGYGYSDDAEFAGYSQSIIEAAQSIKLAAESGDFPAYEAGLSKIATTCQNCHSKYKND